MAKPDLEKYYKHLNDASIDDIQNEYDKLDAARLIYHKIASDNANNTERMHRWENLSANDRESLKYFGRLHPGLNDMEFAAYPLMETQYRKSKDYLENLLNTKRRDMNNTSTHTTINQPKQPEFQTLLDEQELLDVIDEIAGTQTVTVKGENGKRMRKISRLPRTDQEEQYYQQGQNLIGKALNNLSQLFENKPEAVVDFKPVIDTFAKLNDERVADLAKRPGLEGINQYVNEFRDYQRNILDDVFTQHKMQQESQLAQSGHYNSTAGHAHRAYMAKQEGLARQQADINARTYGEDIMAKRQQNFNTEYAANEQARKGQLDQALQQYTLAQQQKQDKDTNNAMQLQNALNQLQTGYTLTGQDLQKAMASKSAELGLKHSTGIADSAFKQASLNNQMKQQQFQNELNAQNQTNQLIASLLDRRNASPNASTSTGFSSNAQAGQNKGTTFGYEKPFSN
ncbi:hypothetical protein [Cysteiniphilum halobium]|uniref:hypothetical protein n=1 Tax=Cysteiniphilum halobium TaxID=2219059 RepID=UPI003F85E69E